MKRTFRRVIFIGAAEGIYDVETIFMREFIYGFVLLRIFQEASESGLLSFLYSSLVHQTVSLLTSSTTEKLILGRAAGVDAGHYIHCTEFGYNTLFRNRQVLRQFHLYGVVHRKGYEQPV